MLIVAITNKLSTIFLNVHCYTYYWPNCIIKLNIFFLRKYTNLKSLLHTFYLCHTITYVFSLCYLQMASYILHIEKSTSVIIFTIVNWLIIILKNNFIEFFWYYNFKASYEAFWICFEHTIWMLIQWCRSKKKCRTNI